MLNEFRTQKFTWDKATNKFHKTVRLASTDEHGRKLIVQVINNGQIEDLSSVLLNLYWETKDKAHKGLDAFTPIDASQGLFEIYYTTEMLSNIGELKANLYLVDQGAVTSEPFILNVFEGIDTEAVESDDSFTALVEALLRVQEIETQEQERKDAEEARKTAEATRESNESTRKSNETSRKSAETKRVNAEADRVDAETTRATAESGRVSAEDTRVTNENTRKTNENNRKTAETNRESAEATRQSTFESNEAERESQYQDLVDSVSGLEDDYAPRLTSVEAKTEEHIEAKNIHRPMKIFNTIPDTSQLLDGEVGLVIEENEWQEALNLRFNEYNTNPIKDYSGNRLDASVIGGVTTVNGLTSGKARRFNGTSGYASTEPTYILAGKSKMRFEVVFRIHALPTNPSAAQTIFNNYRDSNYNLSGFYVNVDMGSAYVDYHLAIRFNDGNSDTTTVFLDDYIIKTNTNYRAVVEFDSGQAITTLYDLSGKILATKTINTFNSFPDRATPFNIGGTKNASGVVTNFANATIDTIKLRVG